jgi:diguanylate cyclase (GGDEF)-like protein
LKEGKVNTIKKLIRAIQVSWQLGSERVIALQAKNTALEKENEDLYEKAMHDKLTGLFNWRFFEEVLKVEIERVARQEEQPLSIAFFDVDKLKVINDTFGHPKGNEVLKEIGRVLRETDFACRWAGDEFVIVLPGVTKKFVEEKVVRRIISELKAKDIHLSYAILSWEKENHSSMEEFMDELDTLLYKNKRQKQEGLGLVKA